MSALPSPPPDPALLLAWYDRHARALPWRVLPHERRAGQRIDPYAVWLSEIMLQQTTVAVVKSYFNAFRERWPRLSDLAAAPLDEVLKAWAGLGYYSRARNLKAAAELLMRVHEGSFPETEAALRRLPGVGAYTAAAIAAIAFDRPATVVDGNIERVMARLYALQTPLPAAKSEIRVLAERLTPRTRPGDYAQALMDLGATICTPKNPACGLCPWKGSCLAHQQGIAAVLPRRAKKTERPHRHGRAFVAVREDGALLLRRRPAAGLLGGMTEVPGTPWLLTHEKERLHDSCPPLPGLAWMEIAEPVRHVFTHFTLELTVLRAATPFQTPIPEGYWWSTPSALAGEALPSVMRKVIACALSMAPKS